MPADLLDRSVFGESANAFDFVTSLLQASTEHSIIGVDLDGIIVLWNEGACRHYGYKPGEVIGSADISLLHVGEDIEADRPHEILDMAVINSVWEGKIRQRRKSGESFVARAVVTPCCNATGGIAGFLLISRDSSKEILLASELQAELDARVRAELALRESEQRYRVVAETATDAIFCVDERDTITFVNQAGETIFGYSVAKMLGRAITLLIPELPPHLHKRRSAHTGIEMTGRHKNGHAIALEVAIGEYRDKDRHLFTMTARDITERKRSEERIRYLAQHDALTGLPNRLLFRDRLSRAIIQARRSRGKVAVLFLDLDGFKHVNDSLGHQVGDELLRQVGQRLLGCLREGDTVCRVGGDEFVICLPVSIDDRDGMLVAEKILTTLRESFVFHDNELHVAASIGISLYPTDGEDPEVLMRTADTAMYYAKDRGRNNYQFFTPHLNGAARRRLQIVNQLHRALSNGEFRLVYQPQVELANRRILGVEALLRWQWKHADTPLPGEVVQVAEDTGLIVPIGEWVLRESCRQLSRWRAAGYEDLRIAVNLSPVQVRQPDFGDMVLRILFEAGLPAVALDLEITENILMTQSAENIDMLAHLAGAGVQLAVDDFGTGYSSFAYLQKFPIDTIKIDRSFVNGVAHDRNDTGIVMAMITMAENLKLHVVAEGVETAAQAKFLYDRGCLVAQGYYFYRPMAATAINDLLGYTASQ
jgi:diguanylate cyclase (GGDEF)-like protein/PAS domain S-box-containing protein